jgi:hypothetical protein
MLVDQIEMKIVSDLKSNLPSFWGTEFACSRQIWNARDQLMPGEQTNQEQFVTRMHSGIDASTQQSYKPMHRDTEESPPNLYILVLFVILNNPDQ